MYDYIVRIDNLMGLVSKILNHNSGKVDKDQIREEYKALKQAIKEDAHYMDLLRNQKEDNSILQNQFNWVIGETSAFGFTSATNSKIDYAFFDSLAEARYKLTKHTSLEKWKELSEN
jgi:hypothetical protein